MNAEALLRRHRLTKSGFGPARVGSAAASESGERLERPDVSLAGLSVSFLEGGLTVDAEDTVKEIKTKLAEQYSAEVKAFKWHVTGFVLIRALAPPGSPPLEDDTKVWLSQPNLACWCCFFFLYHGAQTGWPRLWPQISELAYLAATPLLTVRSPEPQTVRDRVGGGFQIKAPDPVSGTLLGMDRYLKVPFPQWLDEGCTWIKRCT